MFSCDDYDKLYALGGWRLVFFILCQLHLHVFYIHLYSPHNMVAQTNKTGTSKNTTNEKEKK